MRNIPLVLLVAPFALVPAPSADAGEPAPGGAGRQIALIRAYGAQVYECRVDGSSTLSWKFREPIATLVHGGKTVGRHYAGPSWELTDGTVVKAKVVGQSPAATAADIPHLTLSVISAQGPGPVAAAGTVLRVNTSGGVAPGACSTAGEMLSVPYSADYAFVTGTPVN